MDFIIFSRKGVNLMNNVKDVCCPDEAVEPAKDTAGQFTSLGPVGAVITAILASLCRVGPFVLVMLGVSGAWIGNLRAFEPYRPIFILLTIGFLIAGFYRVYRKSAEVCEPGSLCEIPQTKRVSKIVLWTATIFVVFLLILPYLIGLLV
jgi:mercuric ion transport protein